MQNSKKGEGNKAEKSGQLIHIEQEQLTRHLDKGCKGDSGTYV